MLNDFDKNAYKSLKRMAKLDGVKVATRDTDNETYNGVSVAFAPMLEAKDGRMLLVSASYCCPQDSFSKKVGKFQALSKFYRGETIQLPLAQHKDMPYFKEHVLDVFNV